MHGPLAENVESFRTRLVHSQTDAEEAAGHYVGLSGIVHERIGEAGREALTAVTAVKLAIQKSWMYPQGIEEGEAPLPELGTCGGLCGGGGSLPLQGALGDL